MSEKTPSSQKRSERAPFSLTCMFRTVILFLCKHSLFEIIRRNVIGRNNGVGSDTSDRRYELTEMLAASNFAASIVCSVVAYVTSGFASSVSLVLGFYGIYRIFEILIAQMKILLIDPFDENGNPKRHGVKSVQRSIVSVMANYVEIVFWFATLSIAFWGYSFGQPQMSWSYLVTASMIGCVTSSTGTMTSALAASGLDTTACLLANWPYYLEACEAFVGVVMNVFSISCFVGALPPIRSLAELQAEESASSKETHADTGSPEDASKSSQG